MIRPALLSASLWLLGGSLHAAELQPFQASYEMWLDGKRIGVSRIALSVDADGLWSHTLHADGTAGLARWARAHSEQSARFDLADGLPRLLWARMNTRSLVSNRDTELRLNWPLQQLQWYGDLADGQPQQRTIDGQPTTGSLLNLQLALDAQRLLPGQHVAYVLHDRGRAKPVDYQLISREAIDVPAGRYQATALRYQRDDQQRSTTLWFAEDLPATPVRVLQMEDGEAKYELRLLAISGN